MTVKNLRPGKTQVTAKGRGSVHKKTKDQVDPPGGLYPIRMSAWATDDFRIANGWPVSIPDYDIKARTLVSAEGEVLAYREQARDVVTSADLRWIADDEYYNLTDLQWYPHQAETPINWSTSAEYAPTYLSDYEYELRSEVFVQEALNFDSDSTEHMWTDLTQALGGVAGYTVIFSVSPSSAYGNNLETPYAGLWCPGQPTVEPMSEAPEGGWVSLTLQGNTLYLQTDQTRRKPAMPISDLLSTAAPVMIAMVIDRPYISLYAGRGPSGVTKVRVDSGSDVVPMDGRVVLGRSNGDLLHTADMTLMEINLYSEILTGEEVRDEFSLLSSIYGGDK